MSYVKIGVLAPVLAIALCALLVSSQLPIPALAHDDSANTAEKKMNVILKRVVLTTSQDDLPDANAEMVLGVVWIDYTHDQNHFEIDKSDVDGLTWDLNAMITTHIDCDPMEPYFLVVTLVESDQFNFGATVIDVANDVAGLFMALGSAGLFGAGVAAFLGGSTGVVIGVIGAAVGLTLSIIGQNGDDNLGIGIGIADKPGTYSTPIAGNAVLEWEVTREDTGFTCQGTGRQIFATGGNLSPAPTMSLQNVQDKYNTVGQNFYGNSRERIIGATDRMQESNSSSLSQQGFANLKSTIPDRTVRFAMGVTDGYLVKGEGLQTWPAANESFALAEVAAAEGRHLDAIDYLEQSYLTLGESFPSSPQDLTVSPGEGGLEVTWDPVPLADGYKVYRGSVGEERLFLMNDFPLAPPRFLDTDIREEGEFYYTVTYTLLGAESAPTPMTRMQMPLFDTIALRTMGTSPAVFTDISGNQMTDISVGKMVIVAGDVWNTVGTAQNFRYMTEIRDSNGVTVNLSFQSGTSLSLDRPATLGFSWMPELPGTYEVRTFLISDEPSPSILSSLEKSTLVVS